jgi:sugar/nucleoside kinase (ribokinase family)
MFSKPLDVLAIGDTTIDAFIRLKDARVHCSIDDEKCEICLRFADKVPYDSVTVVPAVGNSANAAVSCARLGLRSGLLAVVGNDQNGETCLLALKKENVDTRYMRTQKGIDTNYHYVLWYESDRTILIKQNQYDYSIPSSLKAPKWIYLSSLGEHTLPFHEELAAYVAKNPEVKLAFQPGTFQMKMGTDKLKDIYAHTDIFFCNKEEAQRILGGESADTGELIAALHALGPKTVVITDGRKGLSASNGNNRYTLPIYPDRKPPFERTGAGDATASTIVAALSLGYDLKVALTWGPVNSMAVVEEVGAQKGLLQRGALEQLLASAPAEYRVTDF